MITKDKNYIDLEPIEIRNMVSEAPYSFFQRDSSNKSNPVKIERYHEDEYIYIYRNNAGDGLIFRDRAMKEAYENYNKFLKNTSDDSYAKINFDSFSIDINSLSAYPGVYVFVYDKSVPEFMRTLAPALIESPMDSNSFNLELLDDGLKRLGTTYVFYNPNSNYQQEYSGSISSLNEEGVGDILIPSGEDLNKLFNALGMTYSTRKTIREEMQRVNDNLQQVVVARNNAATAALQNINTSIETLEVEVSAYTSQIAQKDTAARNLSISASYVLQPTNQYSAAELATQQNSRNQYNDLIEQIQSLTALRESSGKSLKSLKDQKSEINKEKEDAIAKEQKEAAKSIKELEALDQEISKQMYVPRSFRITVPLKSRLETSITKAVIYDHIKDLKTAAQLADPTVVGSTRSHISLYRSAILDRNDENLFHGVNNDSLIQKSWQMQYAHYDMSSLEEYVSYYVIDPESSIRTSITRSEYESRIDAVSVIARTKRMEEFFEIVITPPQTSVLSSGQPEYDFSLVHSTMKNIFVKRDIDSKKIYSNPSIAIDFGEEVGEERDNSKQQAISQQLGQGSYRAVTSFKVKREGPLSRYGVAWKDTSGNKLDLKHNYDTYINTPTIVRDSLCGKYSALEFSPESIAIRTQSFVPEYSFDNGFSIFFVVKQNEENSVGNSGLNAMFPSDKYKNGFLEIEWPESTADSSDIELYKEEYALNYLYYKSNLMYLDNTKYNILGLVDTKGIDRDSSHEITTPISAVSAGINSASGFSKANFFESDIYSILEVEYNGDNSF